MIIYKHHVSEVQKKMGSINKDIGAFLLRRVLPVRGKRVAQKSSLKVDSWGEVRALLSKRYLSSEVLLASVCFPSGLAPAHVFREIFLCYRGGKVFGCLGVCVLLDGLQSNNRLVSEFESPTNSLALGRPSNVV